MDQDGQAKKERSASDSPARLDAAWRAMHPSRRLATRLAVAFLFAIALSIVYQR